MRQEDTKMKKLKRLFLPLKFSSASVSIVTIDCHVDLSRKTHVFSRFRFPGFPLFCSLILRSDLFFTESFTTKNCVRFELRLKF